jgi:type II secretory pathway pseudopilin PulG
VSGNSAKFRRRRGFTLAYHTRTLARAAGFTYIGLLIAIVIMGVALSAVGVVWRTQAQREREQQLLFIGHDFERAIGSYYRAGGQFPQEIDDLLEDKRRPIPLHHLRRYYNDPMTGARDWNIIRADFQGITGIASSSKDAPIKKDGFNSIEGAFNDATSYSDWKFVYQPRLRLRRPAVPKAAD